MRQPQTATSDEAAVTVRSNSTCRFTLLFQLLAGAGLKRLGPFLELGLPRIRANLAAPQNVRL